MWQKKSTDVNWKISHGPEADFRPLEAALKDR